MIAQRLSKKSRCGWYGRNGALDKSGVREAFLDRPVARVLAALVIILCGTLLGYVHRDDVSAISGLKPDDMAAGAPSDPAAPCIGQRFAEIDVMIADGVIGSAQADLFKQRAEAMCRSTEGGGNGPPLLPN